MTSLASPVRGTAVGLTGAAADGVPAGVAAVGAVAPAAPAGAVVGVAVAGAVVGWGGGAVGAADGCGGAGVAVGAAAGPQPAASSRASSSGSTVRTACGIVGVLLRPWSGPSGCGVGAARRRGGLGTVREL